MRIRSWREAESRPSRNLGVQADVPLERQRAFSLSSIRTQHRVCTRRWSGRIVHVMHNAGRIRIAVHGYNTPRGHWAAFSARSGHTLLAHRVIGTQHVTFHSTISLTSFLHERHPHMHHTSQLSPHHCARGARTGKLSGTLSESRAMISLMRTSTSGRRTRRAFRLRPGFSKRKRTWCPPSFTPEELFAHSRPLGGGAASC